jgi:DNA polymerase-4
VVGVPRGACAAKSREIREALVELAPVVQPASIDEFYLDLSGTERLFAESLEATAWRIRKEILERTGVSVSIGGGTRRMIAKLAAGLAKPAGVHIVAPSMELDFMRRLELSDIPGIGPALLDSLRDRGLNRVEEALEIEEHWLQAWFGDHRGSWLFRRVRGLDDSLVDPRSRRKSISSERTFFEDLDGDEDLEHQLLKQVESVGKVLRRKALRTRTITVKLRDNDFRTRSASHTVPDPIESDRAIFEVGRVLLRSLRSKRRRPARLLGVGATNLGPASDAPQLAFFEASDELEGERDRMLSKIMDGLRERFGDDAIVPGRMVRK